MAAGSGQTAWRAVPEIRLPGNVGVPDRIIILDCKVIFVELKTDTGRLSPKQVAMHRMMMSRGADVRVVYGMDEARQLVWDLERMLE